MQTPSSSPWTVMQTPSPWATKADVEAAREALKADIAALHAELRAVKALLTDQSRRSWWRRLFTAGAVVVAVMAVSAGARADIFKTGNDLYSDCQSKSLFCLGYIEAIADAMAHSRVNGYTACFPPHMTAGQVLDVVMQSLAIHPEERHMGAAGLVAAALEGAFPCRR